MRRKKLMAIALMVAAFMVIASAEMVRGTSSRVTLRPLSDWTENNWLLAAFWIEELPDGGMIAWAPLDSSSFPQEGRCDGYVKERELNDGRAEITVHVHLLDAGEVGVGRFDPQAGWSLIVVGGTATGTFAVKFILPEPGLEIPDIFTLPVEDIVLWHLSFSGPGILTSAAAAYGFTPGATAIVTVVQEMLRTPKADPIIGFWPVEMVDVHEIG